MRGDPQDELPTRPLCREAWPASMGEEASSGARGAGAHRARTEKRPKEPVLPIEGATAALM
jgi:hypothetical protein